MHTFRIRIIGISFVFRVRRFYGSGCRPEEMLMVLMSYEGEFTRKVRTFVSDYCSHLASGNDRGIDPTRAQRLALFMSSKQKSQ